MNGMDLHSMLQAMWNGKRIPYNKFLIATHIYII
jgi:hypothetical protein